MPNMAWCTIVCLTIRCSFGFEWSQVYGIRMVIINKTRKTDETQTIDRFLTMVVKYKKQFFKKTHYLAYPSSERRVGGAAACSNRRRRRLAGGPAVASAASGRTAASVQYNIAARVRWRRRWRVRGGGGDDDRRRRSAEEWLARARSPPTGADDDNIIIIQEKIVGVTGERITIILLLRGAGSKNWSRRPWRRVKRNNRRALFGPGKDDGRSKFFENQNIRKTSENEIELHIISLRYCLGCGGSRWRWI